MKEYTRETLLTTVAELQSKLGSPNLCIIDVRPAEDYAKGHIPGATHCVTRGSMCGALISSDTDIQIAIRK